MGDERLARRVGLDLGALDVVWGVGGRVGHGIAGWWRLGGEDGRGGVAGDGWCCRHGAHLSRQISLSGASDA